MISDQFHSTMVMTQYLHDTDDNSVSNEEVEVEHWLLKAEV